MRCAAVRSVLLGFGQLGAGVGAASAQVGAGFDDALAGLDRTQGR